ncbi:sulfatase family protein [Pelagicoccus mobilis]|uniref:Sulfatase-like hydrolase/transferase n=1 Tax=Pelagicoccus mobilis TaxID=415221 RepID=A0A934RWI4_9BACT|nr:sulfatase-like hydrolase/transferase [Pelagicoccus mobilis]MBK1876494.1 sulfatase-like hydrolase/transferase [Pelagicoccus mobilis]
MEKRKPNIIFILSDQQRADTIKAWGYAHMSTPAMDSLVEGGMSFKNCFCPGATCTPSRAAIFTGMYAHNTGTYSFNQWGHQRTWVDDLADSGYWCINVGKMHFQPRDVSGGFHERVVVENPTSVGNWGGNGDDDWGKYLSFHGEERPNYRHQSDPEWLEKWQGVPWHLDEHLHSDAFTANAACGWLKARETDDEPFFMELGFPGPHEPWDAPQEFVDLYEGIELPEPVDFPSDLSNKPPQQAAIRAFHAGADHESRIDMPNAELDDVMRMRRHYYAKISYVDQQVQKVLDTLKETGHLENTIVIFSSDHGEMLGDHGSAYKWLMYDSITRVPLMIKDFRSLGESQESDDLVSLMDIGPTILEMAGGKIPTRLEGRSLTPYLKGAACKARTAVYCEDNYQVMRRTKDEKIVHYIGATYGEYYRLDEDPNEINNLWDDPEFVARRKELQLATLDWLATSSYANYGYKTESESDGEYGIRWHGNDAGIHGDNYKPKDEKMEL